MHLQITNQNVLGPTISIKAMTGEKKEAIIPPQGSSDLSFSMFTPEPRTWTFDVDTNSDAFVVRWTLFSSWIPGDPPNG